MVWVVGKGAGTEHYSTVGGASIVQYGTGLDDWTTGLDCAFLRAYISIVVSGVSSIQYLVSNI